MKRIIIFVSLFCFLTTNAVAAVELMLLGPAQFTRTAGPPNIYISGFAGAEGPARLVVRNGLADGKHRVSSAVVEVNGQVVLQREALNQQVFEIELPLSLAAGNTISVMLASKPGSFLTIAVKQELDVDYAALIGPQGGVIPLDGTARSRYGPVLDIPPGALSSKTLITLRFMDPSGLFDLSPHYHHVGQILDIGPDGLVFDKPAWLRMSYGDEDNDGLVDGTPIDEKDLLIFSSSNNFEQFSIRGNVTDTASNISEIAVPHLTSFGFWSGRWPSDSPLRYKIVNTPLQTDDSPAEIKDAIRSAFSEWQTDLSSVGIYFLEVAVGEEAEISLQWSDQYTGGPALTTGYLVSSPPAEISKTIQFSDDLLSCCGGGVWSASLDAAGDETNAIFVKEVAMHEIGHALGLAHLTLQEQQMDDGDISVMHPYAGFSNLQSLSRIDLQKLRDRYGISGASEIWLLEYEGTLLAPNQDWFGLDGAVFKLTMELDPNGAGTFHDIGAYVLSGYRTTDYSLEISGHGYSLNNSAAVLVWDSQYGTWDRLSIHADITDADEAIPFDFGGDMIFSLPSVYLLPSQFGGTALQPVSNTDVKGVFPAMVWRPLPSGDYESAVIGVENTIISLSLEER